jgi:hypothetical protein
MSLWPRAGGVGLLKHTDASTLKGESGNTVGLNILMLLDVGLHLRIRNITAFKIKRSYSQNAVTPFFI